MSAGGDRLREALLDAARDLLGQRPWARITMSDVARAGGVSRQTVYNELGSRAQLAQALVLREADEFLSAVEDELRSRPADPVGAMRGALERFLASAEEDPLVRAVVVGGEGDLLELVTTRGGAVVEYGSQRLAAVIVEVWPQARREDADLLADCLVRLGISHAALPGGSAAEVAAGLASVLSPFVERALGR